MSETETKNPKKLRWLAPISALRDDSARESCAKGAKSKFIRLPAEAALKLPATGPIGLEGDRGQMEYRRLRVKTLAR